jgi:hypothetical protein
VFELAIAAIIVALLVAAAMIPPLTLVWAGAALGSLGALVSIPAGLVYHARLWRALRANGLETRGIWLRPTRLHERLPEHELDAIRVVFMLGAGAFVLTLVGAAGVVTGLVRLFAG